MVLFMSNVNVCILTPTTSNRLKFMDLMVSNISKQTYNHASMKWVVVGDVREETRQAFQDAFATIPDVLCKYIPCDIGTDIGAKRNFACAHCDDDINIILNMDDDDIYMESYVQYSVSRLLNSNNGIVCCKTMLLFFPQNEGKMVFISGQAGHEATFCHTKEHWRKHRYKNGLFGEGKTMVKTNFDNQMDIRKVMVCVVHDQNTYDKRKFIDFPEVQLSRHQRNALMQELPNALT